MTATNSTDVKLPGIGPDGKPLKSSMPESITMYVNLTGDLKGAYPGRTNDGRKNFNEALELYEALSVRKTFTKMNFALFLGCLAGWKSLFKAVAATIIAIFLLSGNAKAEMEILTPTQATAKMTVSKWDANLFPPSTLQWILRHQHLMKDKLSLVMTDKPIPFMPKNIFCSRADFTYGRAVCMAVSGIGTNYLRYEIHINPDREMMFTWSRFDLNQHIANMNRATLNHNYDAMAGEIVAVMQFVIENF